MDKSHFEEDGTQNYLVFQPMHRYFKRVGGAGCGNCIYCWKSKGLSYENITAPSTTDFRLNPQLRYFVAKRKVEFKGSSLKQENNYRWSWEISKHLHCLWDKQKLWHKQLSNTGKLLFGAVGLTKNDDIDNYKYSGYLEM